MGCKTCEEHRRKLAARARKIAAAVMAKNARNKAKHRAVV